MNKTSKGYVLEIIKGHPIAQTSGVVLQHRRIWFDKYGAIPKGHVIHHKNGNPTDNRLSNLCCLSRAMHSLEHHPHGFKKCQRRPKQYKTLKCSNCNITFKRNKARIRDSVKRNKSDRLYCSKRCACIFNLHRELNKESRKGE